MELKKCKVCGVEKPLSEFPTQYHKIADRYYTGHTCRECRNKRNRDNNLYRDHGMYRAQYDFLSEKQGGVCAICSQPETAKDRNGKIKRLAVDHNHATRKNRGLLCYSCNLMLGHARDNSDNLRKAAEYIDKNQPWFYQI